jgi:hypothetical protein
MGFCHRGEEGAERIGIQLVTVAPIPRVFPKKRLDLLDCKGVDFLGSAKRRQIAEKMGFATEAQRAQRRGRSWSKRGMVTPRGFCMDVKTRELWEKGFVRV